MRIVTCAQMKDAERAAGQNGMSSLRLMENAGTAAARFIRETATVSGAAVTVLCGRGNNGGDGFVCARKLLEHGAKVTAVLVAGAPSSPDAAEMLERLRALSVPVLDFKQQPKHCCEVMQQCDMFVDAVFGTGFHGALPAPLPELFAAVNSLNAKIFALDMPSGANADTGEVSEGCLKADYTIAFAAPKAGQFAFPAAEYCGVVKTVNIGIPDETLHGFSDAVELLEQKQVERTLPVRPRDTSKTNYGRLLIICGSVGLSGAAALATRSALRCGAGLVTLAVPKPIYELTASKIDEALVVPYDATETGSFALSALDKLCETAEKSSAVLLGCGLSQNPETLELVRSLVARVSCPIVLDADGINAFAGHIDLLRSSKARLVLTPHNGEMARLTGQTIPFIKSNRLHAATSLATQAGLTLVLKGANTVIATGAGRAYINPTGNPGMARGGSGDVLAGMIASLLAQGISPDTAACCGAYLHGMAGDRCAAKLSQYAMLPGDMIAELPQIFRELSR